MSEVVIVIIVVEVLTVFIVVLAPVIHVHLCTEVARGLSKKKKGENGHNSSPVSSVVIL